MEESKNGTQDWWVNYIIETNEDFEKYYCSLRQKLIDRFENDFEAYQNREAKANFLQELMDEILHANHEMNHNYNISEIAEKNENDLKSLMIFFESENQKLFIPRHSSKKIKSKAGRKKAITKNAKEYLSKEKFLNDNHKRRFIELLQESYKNYSHKNFNFLMRVLNNERYLEKVENVCLKEAFEKAFEREPQSQTNFNNQFNISRDEKTPEYKAEKERVNIIFEKSFTC